MLITFMVGQCQLPKSEFKWMTDDELDDWKHLFCILDVDLEYPEQLHDLHKDYPDRVKIENVEKLIPNLINKTHYVVHYENYTEALTYKLQKFIEVLNLKKVLGWKNTLI